MLYLGGEVFLECGHHKDVQVDVEANWTPIPYLDQGVNIDYS